MEAAMGLEVPPWRPPEGGFKAADLDRLPGFPPHTELIDGGLFFASRPPRGRQELLSLLHEGMSASCPPDLCVIREMSVILGNRQRPEPDLAVIKREALGDGRETWYPGGAVILVVEVVSADTEILDRERKPQLYGQSGIKYLWRVERSGEQVAVFAYELDPATSVYVLTGIHRDQVRVSLPFEMSFDLAKEVRHE